MPVTRPTSNFRSVLNFFAMATEAAPIQVRDENRYRVEILSGHVPMAS
jgi:hypothetical protein